MSSKFRQSQFPVTVALLQIAFVILAWKFVGYSFTANAENVGKATPQPRLMVAHEDNRQRYPMFQDVHVMIFIGFGFLMTFLKKYAFSAVSYNLLLSAIVIQWACIVRSFVSYLKQRSHFNIMSMILADFDCAIVLISFGALLGKTSPMQLLLLALVEIPLAQLNGWLSESVYHAADIGGSMILHAFGAYFGLAAALALHRKENYNHPKNGSSYNSDIFSMIGTLFLWVFWPSFNGALANGDLAERAVINTYFSLCAATVTTFCLSLIMQPKGKFKMVMVQNATLAGGVGVGSVANFMIQPFGALLVGIAAGMISVIGYGILQPALERIKIHDTCGVHNLHGMPGVMSGLASALAAALASTDMYGTTLYVLFPQRAPINSTTMVTSIGVQSFHGTGRTASSQALYQLACLGTTLAISIVGGLITGALLRCPFIDQVEDIFLFEDVNSWEVPDEEEAAEEVNDIVKSNYTITSAM